MRALTDFHATCWAKQSMCIPCQPCTLLGALSAASQNFLGEAEANVITVLFPIVTQTLRVLHPRSRAAGACWHRLTP